MTEFNVPDMSCGHCKTAIEKAVAGVDPAADVQVDLAARMVRITSDRPDQAVIAAIRAAGYDATLTS